MIRRVFIHFWFVVLFPIACVAADKHTTIAELFAMVTGQ